MADDTRTRTRDTEGSEANDPGGGRDALGQRIERDTELAERIATESDSDAEAERRFEEDKEGPRPEDLPTEQRP